MSHLSPEHITGASNNTDKNVPSVSPQEKPVSTSKSHSKKRKSKRKVPLSSSSSSDSSSEDFPHTSSKGKGKKRNYSTPIRGTPHGNYPLFSLPNQNLDASIHAPYYNNNPMQLTNYGNHPQSQLLYSPSPMNFPPYPLPPTFGATPNEFIGSSSHPTQSSQNRDHTSPPTDTQKEITTGSQSRPERSKPSYLSMAKYSLGKPTFNMDEPSHSIYQSASPHALVYDISLLDQVPTNQLASSINLQIGKAVRGVKVKYTNNKRSHLELAFFTKEAADTWEKKPITLIGKDLLPTRAFNGNKSFFSISLSGVPLCDTQEITSQLQKIFEKVSKIATIKPKLWESTSFTSDNCLITFDTTGIKDISMLSANIPKLIFISRDRVYVT